MTEIWLTDERGSTYEVRKLAARYIQLRRKAALANLAWLETHDDVGLRKRDGYLFRAAEIVTTIRALLGHEASKQFAVEANRFYGPVAFWPEPESFTIGRAHE